MRQSAVEWRDPNEGVDDAKRRLGRADGPGERETAIAAFATAYADRNERDFERLREAVRTGRLDARRAE